MANGKHPDVNIIAIPKDKIANVSNISALRDGKISPVMVSVIPILVEKYRTDISNALGAIPNPKDGDKFAPIVIAFEGVLHHTDYEGRTRDDGGTILSEHRNERHGDYEGSRGKSAIVPDVNKIHGHRTHPKSMFVGHKENHTPGESIKSATNG